MFKTENGISTERMLAYSELSGRLYVPNHEPTLFTNLNKLKKTIKKTKKYNYDNYPDTEINSEYFVYKVNFTLLDN